MEKNALGVKSYKILIGFESKTGDAELRIFWQKFSFKANPIFYYGPTRVHGTGLHARVTSGFHTRKILYQHNQHIFPGDENSLGSFFSLVELKISQKTRDPVKYTRGYFDRGGKDSTHRSAFAASLKIVSIHVMVSCPRHDLHNLWNVYAATPAVESLVGKRVYGPERSLEKKKNGCDDACHGLAIFRFSFLRRYTLCRVFNYVLPEFLFRFQLHSGNRVKYQKASSGRSIRR